MLFRKIRKRWADAGVPADLIRMMAAMATENVPSFQAAIMSLVRYQRRWGLDSLHTAASEAAKSGPFTSRERFLIEAGLDAYITELARIHVEENGQ